MIASLLLAAALAAPPGDAGVRVRHALRVSVDPSRGWLAVSDEIRLPAGQPADLLLNASLVVKRADPMLEEVPLGDLSAFGVAAAELPKAVRLKRYRAKAAVGALRIEYEGPFDLGLSEQKEEYTRGFRQSPGIVSPQGLYLPGEGFWYPRLGPGLVEFEMEMALPPGWHVIAPGNGTSRDESARARWSSAGPVDEIVVVGGPLTKYADSTGAALALVYLREPDAGLAAKYLAATAEYVEMYRGLIGPYPYAKFALVENFWETGYGMPSYTLLGPQVLRFPFILTSSYPHEILHNWWGNSVFVDYPSGNWCEGLTAYLADHLIQEQRGAGAEYRRATLQKYRDYVKDGRDFPLSEFRSRESAATEAVGYGKTLMGFHMLRGRMGDEAFKGMLQRLYRDYRGRRASFTDVRKVAESASGQDLARFFEDWVSRPGAAALEVSVSGVKRAADSYEIAGTLRQAQGGAPFALDVPVAVQTRKGAARERVRLDGAQAPFTLRVAEEPLALHVDPEFDVFRKLDPRETPASIGQIFGEPRILALLSSQDPPARQRAYRELLASWQSDSHAIEVRLDSEVEELPLHRSVWLLGLENRLASRVALAPDAVLAEARRIPSGRRTVVLVGRHPRNVEKAVGWIYADSDAALPGLGRKLPHYGKYSYLGFEGEEPTNVMKGQGIAGDSPLSVDLRPASERSAPLPPLGPEARRPLAEPAPVFSQKALLDHVAYLSSPELEGRGMGGAGLKKAASYVAGKFRELGLMPGGDSGGFVQELEVEGAGGRKIATGNVVGYVLGSRDEWRGQSLIVSAHYDHLGFGWPDVHKGDEGRLHPGADDNASGVAILLELARLVASREKPERTIVFVAFTGEEEGLAGSRHYVEHPLFPLDRVIGVLNLDTVGRLSGQPLSVLGTGTASEWVHIFRGASFVTGVETRAIPESLQSSDQLSFIARGVPGVQLFTQAHADYHRPGDTADKIDGAGLVKVALVAREAVLYLAERPQPLSVTIAATAAAPGAAPAKPQAPAGARRVSFGTVPDFAFSGPGVRVSGVIPGSPAARAGVREGDVIRRLEGRDVADLQGFSDMLKTLSPGQAVAVSIERGGAPLTLSVTVVER